MKLVDAFIRMTTTAYFYAAVLGLVWGVQFDRSMGILAQSIAYIIVGIIFVLADILYIKYDFDLFYYILGIGYIFVALMCYGGLQDWGSVGHNLLMTCWDLAISVAFLTKL